MASDGNSIHKFRFRHEKFFNDKCNILIKYKLCDIYVLILTQDGSGFISCVTCKETPFKICKHPVGSLDEIYSDWEP